VSFRRTGPRPSLLAFLGFVAAIAFIFLASSLGGPDLPVASATAGYPTLPADLRSLLPGGAEASTEPGGQATPAIGAIAIVPVTSFRNPWASTSAAEVANVVAGRSSRYAAVEVTQDEAALVLQAIAVPTSAAGSRVIVASDAATLRADLAAHPDRLGFLASSDVDPSVRALGWDGLTLFGVQRVATLDGWPLTIAPPPGTVPATATPYDPATAWTLVAVGDINLDGGVAYHVKQLHLGVNFPFDGGTATITGRTCCSAVGLPLPIARRTGNGGAVRDLLSLSDLSLADFESPAPNRFTYHPAGLTFTADPALIEGLSNAGIDWVSLANNHIGDAGGQGILDTLQNLDTWGIAHGGAEASLDAARSATLLDAGGITVGILGYDTIRPASAAGPDRPGTNEMSATRVQEDVAAARAAGAQLVVVFAHWGTEYTAQTTARQRALAHAAIDAGADIVIGSHTHWAGGVEIYRGKPILYSLGDFVFDVQRSEQTEEGIIVEATYEGTTLVQLQLVPYVVLDGSQPNLLDPAGRGKVVLRQVFGASPDLPW